MLRVLDALPVGAQPCKATMNASAHRARDMRRIEAHARQTALSPCCDVRVNTTLLLVLLAAGPTPGRWECQSMGADTDATVSVRGDEVVVYRAMYPEFEGKSYKLEHLFKLKLAGTKLSGQLFVRDDPKDGFAPLRAIEGVFVSESEFSLDGTPFKLAEAKDVKDAVPVASGPAPTAAAPAATIGVGYFAQVVGFTASVSDVFALRESITASKEGQTALEAAEAAFAKGQFAPAAAAYQKALGAGVPVSSFAENAARTWLALKDCAHAEPMVASAQRFDPEGAEVQALVADAAKACPRVKSKAKPAKVTKVTLEQLDAELGGAGAPVISIADVEEILHVDEVNRFPAAVAFIATQKDVKARALHGQLELDWAEGLSLLGQMNENLAARLRELSVASEKKAAADGLSPDEFRELGELRAAILESQQTAKVLEAAAAEHLTRGLAIANEVIKANPTNYLGYRLAADSYRLRGDWKAFDAMVKKVEKANPNSNGLLFLKGVAAAQRDKDGTAAKKFLSAALAKDPKFARAQAHQVLIASSLQSAREELEKLKAISPRHPFVVWTGATLEKLEEH